MDINTGKMWPVMLTPFTKTGSIDYNALGKLVDWYEQNGADGLFAVCQSSEMYYLSLKERIELAGFVVKHSKLPVIASGHVSRSLDEQADEIQRISDTGIHAFVLVTNSLARQHEDSDTWIKNLEYILNKIDDDILLGLYECPYPYKRILSEKELKFCISTGRFRFIKDTCCDSDIIAGRLKLIENSEIKLYNANTATLLESLKSGAAGFSGVMANFHPKLYSWLLNNWSAQPQKAELLQSFLTTASLIERQLYPSNAKYYLNSIGLPVMPYCRTQDETSLSSLMKKEVDQLAQISDWFLQTIEN